MGIATGMKDIVQDIASSYETRMAEVGRLKTEAEEMLSSFQVSHKKMGTQLRRDLAQDRSEMGAEVRTMRNGFQTSHKEMGLALSKDLAEHTQSAREEVNKMRQEIKASHQEMSTELKKELAQGVAARKSEVRGMLDDFEKSQERASTHLRRELAGYYRGIKSKVARMRQETGADLRESRTAWQELARGRVPPRAKALAEKETAEGAVPEEETSDLEAKLLKAVAEHPEGITLSQVADNLGIAPIVLVRASISLVGKGKIRREDKLYFPVSVE